MSVLLPTTWAPLRPRLPLTLITWCLAALMALSAPQAEAAKRLALVIGNDAYEEVEPLERAVADARSYRDALQEQRGFQVFYGENTGRRDMNRLVADFLSAIGPGDTAMVVYSGHGVQLDPERRDSLYFLPVDFPNRDPGRGAESHFFDSEALNFARLAENVTARGAKLRIFVLDACRNNPFNRDGGTRSIGLSRGLGRIQSSRGEFVIYAAAPGEVAFDRLPDDGPDSGNSVFTRSFLKHFREGAYLEDVANDVQAEVVALTRAANVSQEPYYSDGVAGRTCIEEECGVPAPPAPPPAAAATATDSPEAIYWNYCESKTEPAYCEAYLQAYPEGLFAPLARARLVELSGSGSETPPATATATETPSTETGPVETPPASADTEAPETPAATAEENTEVAAADPTAAPEGSRSTFVPSREQVRDMQARLTILGLRPGPTDGLMGQRTRSALIEYQRGAGLAPTGEVTDAILSRLARDVPRDRLDSYYREQAQAAARQREARERAAREREERERAERERAAREAAVTPRTSAPRTDEPPLRSGASAQNASENTTGSAVEARSGGAIKDSSGSPIGLRREETESDDIPFYCKTSTIRSQVDSACRP